MGEGLCIASTSRILQKTKVGARRANSRSFRYCLWMEPKETEGDGGWSHVGGG
jgi:hypothetical protein